MVHKNLINHKTLIKGSCEPITKEKEVIIKVNIKPRANAFDSTCRGKEVFR